ncbi:MAG: tRNA dihydrouridine synthase DusB [Gammaproteobacteria bacterium]
MHIGPYRLANKLVLAPMAGITDHPFREICKRHGAGLAVSEMVASNPALRTNERTRLKMNHESESGLCSVQILGTEPRHMAAAARYNVDRGAQIIDINMGCPVKKVCSVAAGSALLKNESLVGRILDAVVGAVDVPVTLKIRTGWDMANRNAVAIANIAKNSGISALTVHGRTRACKFNGEAEYETIKQVKDSVAIPVIANGDIDTPGKARFVLESTGADAIMIGRAARGNPWLFGQIIEFLGCGKKPEKPSPSVLRDAVLEHLEKLYGFYGGAIGVKIARKHIGWYFDSHVTIDRDIRNQINQAAVPSQQIMLIRSAFDLLI